MHGGVIGARSEGEGCGSTFFFELPLFERSILVNLSVQVAPPPSPSPSPLSLQQQQQPPGARDKPLPLEEGGVPTSFQLPILNRLPMTRLPGSRVVSLSQVLPSTADATTADDEIDSFMYNDPRRRLMELRSQETPDGQLWPTHSPSSQVCSNFYRAISSGMVRASSPKLHSFLSGHDQDVSKDEERGLIRGEEGAGGLTRKGSPGNIRQSFSERVFGGIELQVTDTPVGRMRRQNSLLAQLDSQLGRLEGNTGEKERGIEQGEVVSFHFERQKDDDKARRLRVLIVDDTASIRKITAKLLTSLGFDVEEAVDGLAFLQKMDINAPIKRENNSGKYSPAIASVGGKNKVFDVILMDDNMPNMCGPDATAAARAAGYTGLIIGVTGNTYDAQLENFTARGADMVFTKPLDIQKFQEVIRIKFN